MVRLPDWHWSYCLEPDVLRPCCADEQHKLGIGNTIVAEIVDPAGRGKDHVLRAEALFDGMPGLFPAHGDAAFQHEIFHARRIRPLGAACGGHPQGARIDGPGSMPTILISSSTLSWRVKIPIRAKGFVANDMRS